MKYFKCKAVLVFVFMFVGLIGFQSDAYAIDEYVCKLHHVFANPADQTIHGKFGRIGIHTSTTPDCASISNTYYLCSTGDIGCDDQWELHKVAFFNLVDKLHDVLKTDKKVDITGIARSVGSQVGDIIFK